MAAREGDSSFGVSPAAASASSPPSSAAFWPSATAAFQTSISIVCHCTPGRSASTASASTRKCLRATARRSVPCLWSARWWEGCRGRTHAARPRAPAGRPPRQFGPDPPPPPWCRRARSPHPPPPPPRPGSARRPRTQTTSIPPARAGPAASAAGRRTPPTPPTTSTGPTPRQRSRANAALEPGRSPAAGAGGRPRTGARSAAPPEAAGTPRAPTGSPPCELRQPLCQTLWHQLSSEIDFAPHAMNEN